MQLSEIEYPLRLCVEMMHFCAFTSQCTQDMKASEIRSRLVELFGPELVDEAVKILNGNH